jgi:hypothetical protein
MSIEDPMLFADGRTGGVNSVKVVNLGGGLTLSLNIPSGSGPEACLLCASIIGQLGVPVGVLSLAALTPEDLGKVTVWAATELLHRRIEAREPRRDPMPRCLARTMRPVVREARRVTRKLGGSWDRRVPAVKSVCRLGDQVRRKYPYLLQVLPNHAVNGAPDDTIMPPRPQPKYYHAAEDRARLIEAGVERPRPGAHLRRVGTAKGPE